MNANEIVKPYSVGKIYSSIRPQMASPGKDQTTYTAVIFIFYSKVRPASSGTLVVRVTLRDSLYRYE